MKSNPLHRAYDPESFRKQGHQLIDLLADHLGSVVAGQGEVLHYRLPEDEYAFWTKYLNDPLAPPLAETVLEHTTQVHHPRYLGHQVAPPIPLASLAALLGASLNNGMAVYEMGMGPSAMERIVTDWLCRQAGFGPGARGFLTGGGTLANLTGENVLAQLDNLRTLPCVAAKLKAGNLQIHGWLYDIRSGRFRVWDDAQARWRPIEDLAPHSAHEAVA